MKKIYRKLALINSSAILLVMLAPHIRAGVVTDLSYSNDFTSSSAEFATSTPGGSSGWSLNTAGDGFFGHNDAATVTGYYAASVQHTGLGGVASSAQNFSFSGVVDYTSTGVGSQDQLGLMFLGSSADFGSDGSDGYKFYVKGTAIKEGEEYFSLFLERDGVAVGTKSGAASAELRDYFGDTLSYTVTGTYSGGSLGIEAVFLNVTNSDTFTVSYTDTNPLTGNHFGLYDRDAQSSYDMNTQWDSISIDVVPEPSTGMLMILFGSALGLIRLYKRG